MKNKKFVVIMILIIALATMALSACGSSDSGSSSNSSSSSSNSSSSSSNSGAENNSSNNAEPEEKVEDVAWEVGEAIINVWTNSIESKWIQVMVPVTNTGAKNLYFNSAKLDVEDESGHLLESMDYLSFYPEVLQPGETGWVYEETTFENEGAPANVIPHLDFDEATVDCIRFNISDLDIRGDEYGDITVTGRIENNTDEEQTMINVVAFLYDENDMLIGMATTLEDSLKPGDKMGFSATSFSLPDSVNMDLIARYEVMAYPFQLQW